MSSVQLSTNQQQYAQLQAMGIPIFAPLPCILVAELSWLADVCELLKIELADCIFDAATPSFNNNTNKLHLPAKLYTSEQALKKTIWHNIRPLVE